VLESIPKKNIRSGYSKHHTWIDSSSLIPLKENSYDKNGELLKEKEFSYIEMNSFQIIKEIFVKNIQKNHSTKLIFDEIELNIDMKDNMFHEKHLKYMPKL
jgi:negative regulator of sigma E activity